MPPQDAAEPQRFDAPQQSSLYLNAIVNQFQTDTSFRTTTDTAAPLLPRIELVNPTAGAQGIIRNDAGAITGIRHGGAEYQVRQAAQPPGQPADQPAAQQSFEMFVGNQWVPLTNFNQTTGEASFNRAGLNIAMLPDGSTRAQSAGLTTIRYPEGNRAYFRPGQAGGSDTLVGVRGQTGAAYQVEGATRAGDIGTYNVTRVTGGPHNLNLTAGGDSQRTIQVNSRTGQIVVAETRSGQRQETTYNSDGTRSERPAGGGNVRLDGSGRPSVVTRGPQGRQETWTANWEGNPPAIRSFAINRPGQQPQTISDIRNASVDPASGQIRFERNGARFTMNSDGSSAEERGFGQPGAHTVTRNPFGLVTQQDFARADGTPGTRRFHYATNTDGSPVLRNGQPVLDRIDLQRPAPASLVRVPGANGQPDKWRVETEDQNLRASLARHGVNGAWDANPQIDANGNLTFRWHDGRTCSRPADARQDITGPARPGSSTNPGGPAEPGRPGGPGGPGNQDRQQCGRGRHRVTLSNVGKTIREMLAARRGRSPS